MKAIWNGQLLAESEDTVIVEGNHYFPPESIDREFFRDSDTTSFCPWKGTASYHHIEVGDQVNRDAAWFYPDPKDAAKQIRDRIAFWRGVEVSD